MYKTKYLTRRILFLLVFLVIGYHTVDSQSKPVSSFPEIGKSCPDFVLNEIHHYSKSKATLKDFKGKWLILDFWGSGCTSCIATFSHSNELQKKFKDNVQFMLVGTDDKYIRNIYEKVRNRFNLDLPVAYDKLLYKQTFGVPSYPHVVWVDDKSIVRAITYAEEVTEKNISDFLDGKNVSLPKKTNRLERSKQAGKEFQIMSDPLLIDGFGGEDTAFLYRSLISKWKNKLNVHLPATISASVYGNVFQLVARPLGQLYYYAYSDTCSTNAPKLSSSQWPFKSSYNNLWREPILEVKDSSEFIYDWTTDPGKNVFNYSLFIKPKERASSRMIQNILQSDLRNYFGYNVTIERRSMPCWKLKVSKKGGKVLKTKGGSTDTGPESPGSSTVGFSLKNVPISDLIYYLWYYYQSEPPFIDATGIDYNIDVKIEALMTDFDDVKRALHENGLELEYSSSEFNVIVIRDK